MAEAAEHIEFSVKTPGKIILSGEHAVVYGKMALAASIELLTDISVAVRPSRPSVSICFDNLDFRCSLPVADLPLRPAAQVADLDLEFVDLLKLFIHERLPAEADQPARSSLLSLLYLHGSIVTRPVGFDVRVQSAIPIGAGLGSSAALSVGLSAVFHALDHVAGGADAFVADLDRINQWALQCERIFHSTPSGIDNAVCTYGGIVKYQHKVVDSILIPEARILLVNTGVSRQTKVLVDSVRRKRDQFPAVVDPVLESIHQLSLRMADVVQQPSASRYSVIQELLSMNHWLLASLGVSHQTLDHIHSVARSYGQAAKLTGAGGGGLAFVWLDPDCSEENLANLMNEFKKSDYVCWPARLGVKGLQIHFH